MYIVNFVNILKYYFIVAYNTTDTFYWFFSSAAQTVAALVAFIIAGYSIFVGLLGKEAKDDEEKAIKKRLFSTTYNSIRGVIVVSCVSILSSFICLIIVRSSFPITARFYIACFSLFFAFLAVVRCLWFGLKLINPRKFEINATAIINEEKDKLKLSGKTDVPIGGFVEKFIELEREVRRICKNNNFCDLNNKHISYRNGIDCILKCKLIDDKTYDLLYEIGRYRNLVVHGQIDYVDENINKNLLAVLELLKSIDVSSSS